MLSRQPDELGDAGAAGQPVAGRDDGAAVGGGVGQLAQGGRDADPDLARVARTLDEQRLAGATRLAEVVLERLGETDPERLALVRDTIWTFNSPQLYTLLVTQRGWTPERYGEWVARALVALV